MLVHGQQLNTVAQIGSIRHMRLAPMLGFGRYLSLRPAFCTVILAAFAHIY
jgi:hypothetical protein